MSLGSLDQVLVLKGCLSFISSQSTVPPRLALKATPTPHSLLLAEAAITPPQRLPCLEKRLHVNVPNCLK